MKTPKPALSHTEIEVPALPDFTRLPTCPPEAASYRTDGPPRAANNPLYLALPGPRDMPAVRKLIEDGNPTYSPSVRTLPAHMRKERIDDVDGVLFALRRHVALEEMVMTTIRNAFASMPWSERFLEEAAARAHALGSRRSLNSGNGSVGSGSVSGGVGEGKSVSVKKILMGCPQIIKHESFQGCRLGITQVAWLYLSMPPKASTFAFLGWIASILDNVLGLGTNYRDEVERAPNLSERTRIVASKLAIHAVGAVFCDELQNICVGSNTERGLFENTLQELINHTHTRWVFIGTKTARRAVRSEALMRRMIGERGQIDWSSLPEGPEWQEFVKKLWSWSVTSKPTPLTPALFSVLHRLTGGVPDYAKKLFTAAQAKIIGNSNFPDEQLTPEVLFGTMKESFYELHVRLEERYRIQEIRAKRRAAREAKPPAAA